MNKSKKVISIIVCITLFVVFLYSFRINKSAAQDTGPVSLNWNLHPYWYTAGGAEDSFVFKVNNVNQGCKYVYSQETLSGTQSFTYDVTLTAPIWENAKGNAWEQLELYLAIDGQPDLNQDFGSYPGYKDESETVIHYNSFFVKIKREPLAQAAAVLCKIENNVYTEIASAALTEAQCADSYEMQFQFEYVYTSDQENTLTVKLDNTAILTVQDCDALLKGSLGFGTKCLSADTTVTEVSLQYHENPVPVTEPETEPETMPTETDGISFHWICSPYWYTVGDTDSSFVLKVDDMNWNQGGKFIYSEETFDGKKSFTYKINLIAPVVNDNNIKNGGWDTIQIFLAIDGQPDVNQEFGQYPGYKDESGAEKYYDSFFLTIKRYPASQAATVVLCKMADQVYTEIASYELTELQRGDNHNFNFEFDYVYGVNSNYLAVNLDGARIFTVRDCAKLLKGSIGFGAKCSFMTVTELSFEYTNKSPETNGPATDDVFSLSWILYSAVILSALLPALRRRGAYGIFFSV